MSSFEMLPPSPRRKKWYNTINNGEQQQQSYDNNMPLPLTSTPKPVVADGEAHHYDRPPMSVVVIQSTPPEDNALWEGTDEDHHGVVTGEASSSVSEAAGFSPFHTVSKLRPRRPLPVTCVSPPSTAGDRKRRACSIASSIDESTCYSSPVRGPKLPTLPKKDRSSVTPCKDTKQQQQSPVDMDFMIENLSLQSPVARKVGTSPPSKVCVRERGNSFSGNSFSDYIASPARSLHSSFSEYVASPAKNLQLRPRTPSIDSSNTAGGSCATRPSPRKVRLKVLSEQDAVSKPQLMMEQYKFSTPKLSRRHQSSTSLAYSLDGSECSNENMPSPPSKTRIPRLGGGDSNPVLFSNHGDDDMTTPQKLDQATTTPTYSPRKIMSKTSILTPRTPLPKIRLTPRKSPRTSSMGLMPRKPLSDLHTPSPPEDTADGGPVSASLFGGFSQSPPQSKRSAASLFGGFPHSSSPPQSGSKTTRSAATYNVSPRRLFPPGSRLLSEIDKVGSMDALLNNSIETSIAESLRSNMSYMSDSDDEDEFVLAAPAALKEEQRRHGKRWTKLPRR